MLLGINSDFEPASSTGTYNSLATVSAAGTSSQALDLGGPAIFGTGPNGRDLGPGTNGNGPFLVVALNNVTTSATNTTLQFKLQGAPDNSGVPGTWTDYLLSPAYTVAELQAMTGEQFFFPITLPPRPPGVAPPRFYQLAYVSANGSITAGTIYAGLANGRTDWTAGNENFTPPPTSGAG